MIASAFSLVSPNLPIGAFSYSEALESAVENKIVTDCDSFYKWLIHNLKRSLAYFELPVLRHLYESNNVDEFSFWTQRAIAMRNTFELRKEEVDKGKAFVRIISSLLLTDNKEFLEVARRSYLSAFSLYAKSDDLSLEMMLQCYLFSYIESQCIAAVKLVPLGQTDAWKCIKNASHLSDEIIEKSLTVKDDEIGAGLVNLSILSVKHETQYSRIFRS
ncbi:MAG: urease accessory UreF family protein [Succinivibrio sp.]|nr:hypothetical protein [Succinatimonas sp.]MDD6377346.1 urease accessory UreF family protein [Succinatimonas sp.]MDY5064316.1 urease accessory UreF family protein [Succinivibrio sp.]MDY5995621.1 urease accessory UreF family protein [Succinivibrio sp.]